MEAAGLALAVAGLAGQAISGITTLKAFFAAYKAASSKVNNLNFELDSLVSSLQDIEQMVQRAREEDLAATGLLMLEPAAWSVARKPLLQDLKRRMMKCIEEFKTWNEASKGLSIGVWGDVRTFARKIKIAASKDVFEEIAIRITVHRQAIGNSVASLTFFTAQDNLSLSCGIQDQLMSLTSTSNALLASHQTAESEKQQERSEFSAALARLDTSRRDSHTEQMDLLRSMADNISSIASQVASQASGGSWRPNSGRNSPPADLSAGRASPQMAYSPGTRMYTPPQAYGLPYQQPPYGESEQRQGQLNNPWHSAMPYDADLFPPFPEQPQLDPSPFPPPAPLPKKKPAEPSQTWSCGNVLGIDQLFAKTTRCLFCELGKKDKYNNGFFVDTVAFGRHLVEDHRFGGCDLDKTYDSALLFAKHVLVYHCKAAGARMAGHGERLQRFASTRSRSSSPAGDPRAWPLRTSRVVDEQPAATKTLLQTEICCLLRSQGLWPAPRDPDKHSALSAQRDDDARSNADLDGIMAALERLESAADAESTKTLYRVACLMEEATVSELSQRLSLRHYQPADHTSMSGACMLGAFSTPTDGDKPPESFIYGHFVTQPIEEGDNCMGCVLNAKMLVAYPDLSDLKLHLRTEHNISDDIWVDEILRGKVKTIPLRVNPTWLPRFPADDSLANRVDRWMLHCFLMSPNWRILLKTHCQQRGFEAMESWAEDVLQRWQHHSAGSLAHALTELTDGAVNSRDHTATASSAIGSIARPADVRARGGAYACKYHNCVLRFETPSQLDEHKVVDHKVVDHCLRSSSLIMRLSARANARTGLVYQCDRLHVRTGLPCRAMFRVPGRLHRHQEVMHDLRRPKFKCHRCNDGGIFYAINSVADHYKVKHPGEDHLNAETQCALCQVPSTYYSVDALEEHYRDNHPGQQMPVAS